MYKTSTQTVETMGDRQNIADKNVDEADASVDISQKPICRILGWLAKDYQFPTQRQR